MPAPLSSNNLYLKSFESIWRAILIGGSFFAIMILRRGVQKWTESSKKEYQAFYYIYPFYINQAKKTSLDTGRSILMKKVIQYIEDHYQNKITLQEITKELSVSEGYFCRFFKKNFHMTFGDYLVRVRMKEAERRIRETDDTLEQIAMDTGFSNGSYFTIAFKKIYQESARTYRKRSRF